ncbi:MAG: dihydroorotate dehydrogenase electron transfer subunit [Lachnospiraceae bacterium]|nr:dihydroorotate dehydrogenase electron transfer subunit [Lachnospiraceae bacterium]
MSEQWRHNVLKKSEILGEITEHSKISPSIYSMWIRTEHGKDASPGQFVSVYTDDPSMLLPRPISICEYREDAIRIVYRTAGKGTETISHKKAGDPIRLLGILGNGYAAAAGDALDHAEDIVLLGGGIGVPPLLGLAQYLKGKGKTVTAVMGYRDNNLFLEEEFRQCANLVIATEDGSVGIKGNVMDALKAEKIKSGIIFSCGPMPMLRAIKHYAVDENILAYLSLEERMACGVGACLGCVCTTTKEDHHSHVNLARVCTEGPVFEAREVEIG